MANDLRVQLRQIGPSTSEAAIRGHRVLIDRPVEKGGSDQGPMGGELFLASIGGCFMSTLLAAIRARDAAISGVQTEVTGVLEESRFVSVELSVSAECQDAELLEKLVQIADRSCIMMNTLRGLLDVTVRSGARSQRAMPALVSARLVGSE
jgi:putative redox protein